MAEIRIERKGRNLGWLWILLALLLVALLAWYFLASGRDTPAPAAAPPTTGALDRSGPPAHLLALAGSAWARERAFQPGGWYGEEG